ncbi:MAG: hypothetical protein VX464_15485 [Pseudomonadota bacterium]|nr:hypothetical protein [Pseudomonadota bacterium]
MSPETYLKETAPAVEAMFKALNGFNWEKMAAFVDITKARTFSDLQEHKERFYGKHVARDVLAGAILQVAYSGIEKYSKRPEKSEGVCEFERAMNDLIKDAEKSRQPRDKRPFRLPEKFCVGRSIGLLPIGVIIYAARNLHHHPFEKRWSVVNEVVFNYLHQGWPTPPNGLSFNIYDENVFYSYSVLSALGWVYRQEQTAHQAYESDLRQMLGCSADKA